MSNNDDLIQALREIPEVQLRLISLAWEVFRDGTLDAQQIALHSKELAEAVDEASAYTSRTKEAVCALKKMGHSRS